MDQTVSVKSEYIPGTLRSTEDRIKDLERDLEILEAKKMTITPIFNEITERFDDICAMYDFVAMKIKTLKEANHG